MSYEKQKLASMLQENKISKNDYQLLMSAIEHQEDQSLFAWFINPFQKIAGYPALILGLLGIILLSLVGVAAHVYFSSILECLNAANLKNMQVLQPSFLILFSQNIINWLVLAAAFMASALIFGQKRLRIIDFLGTVALSRFPYIILSLLIAVIWQINPSSLDISLAQITSYHFTIAGLMTDFIWQFCFAWQITTYFFALKVSSGLKGTKLWIAFVCSILLTDAVAHAINVSIMWTAA